MEKKMTHNEYQNYLEGLAHKFHTDRRYSYEDFERDAEAVIIIDYNLDKYCLQEEKKKFVNNFFKEEGINRNGHKVLRGFLLNNALIYELADRLSCKVVHDEGLRSFFANKDEKLVLEYCEGDVSLVLCEDERAFKKEIESTIEFYETTSGYKISNPFVSIDEKIKVADEMKRNSNEGIKELKEVGKGR